MLQEPSNCLCIRIGAHASGRLGGVNSFLLLLLFCILFFDAHKSLCHSMTMYELVIPTCSTKRARMLVATSNWSPTISQAIKNTDSVWDQLSNNPFEESPVPICCKSIIVSPHFLEINVSI